MPIYKQYDQAALNAQYNNRLHVPDFARHMEQWELLSRETEKQLPVIKDIPYGKHERERLDIYPSQQPGSKTLVFIHGGYWHKLDKAGFRFMAQAFRSYGITTVLINYPLAPSATMDQVVAACRQAIQWLYYNLAQYNGDPHQLYVAGHSAGGHLTAMLVTTNWQAVDPTIPAGIIKGACALSGLFNLIPIQLSELNDILKMDTAMALRNSPVQLQPATQSPLIIAVGAAETAEFLDQSRGLYTCWKDKIKSIQLLELPALNHYSILEPLLHPASPLHMAMHEMMS